MKRNILHSPKLNELRKRRKRAFFRKSAIVLLVAGVAVGTLAYLSRLSGINIETIKVEGESIVSAEAIQGLAQEKISGSYAWLFPKSNLLIFPKNEIKNSLAHEFKRLDDIELSIKNNRVLVIAVTEREPAYLWCGDESKDCYFMDKTGYIFDEAPYFSGDAYFRWRGSRGVTMEDPRGSLFAPGNFAQMVQFKELVEILGLEPIAMEIKESDEAELFLKSSGTQTPEVRIRQNDDMEQLAENLGTALETEPLKTRMKKEYFKLEYLDLRFDNKVYSKFATP